MTKIEFVMEINSSLTEIGGNCLMEHERSTNNDIGIFLDCRFESLQMTIKERYVNQ